MKLKGRNGRRDDNRSSLPAEYRDDHSKRYERDTGNGKRDGLDTLKNHLYLDT